MISVVAFVPRQQPETAGEVFFRSQICIRPPSHPTQGMCSPLCDHDDWLWTFMDVEGVEPTNNASKQALRPAVIWRKLSFGT